MKDSEKRNLIIILAIFCSAILLGREVANSHYNAFSQTLVTSTPSPIDNSPTSVPTQTDSFYDNTGDLLDQINFVATKPFTLHITENCPQSVDYSHTYIDTFKPTNTHYDLNGWHTDTTIDYEAGTYDMYIDNLCPLTHVTMTYR